jgi:hypothetical protein
MLRDAFDPRQGDRRIRRSPLNQVVQHCAGSVESQARHLESL